MNFQPLETIFECNREVSEASTTSNSISHHSNSSHASTIIDLVDISSGLTSWFTCRDLCTAIHCIDERDCYSVVDRERAMHNMYGKPAKIEADKPLQEDDHLVADVFVHTPLVPSSALRDSWKAIFEDDERTEEETTVSFDMDSESPVDSPTFKQKKKLTALPNKILKMLTFKSSIKIKKSGRRLSLMKSGELPATCREIAL